MVYASGGKVLNHHNNEELWAWRLRRGKHKVEKRRNEEMETPTISCLLVPGTENGVIYYQMSASAPNPGMYQVPVGKCVLRSLE